LNKFGEHSFEDCINIDNITIPNSIMFLNKYLFNRCLKLKSIQFPKSLNEIGDNSMFSCENLETLDISHTSITQIGDFAFKNCIQLKNIRFPNTLKTIANSSFFNCIELEEVKIPESVTLIGDAAFQKCGKLKRVEFLNIDKSSLNNIGKGAFQSTGLETISLPDQVTIINKGTFSACTNLASIKFSSNLERIEPAAFQGCKQLKELPEMRNIKLICNDALSGTLISEISVNEKADIQEKKKGLKIKRVQKQQLSVQLPKKKNWNTIPRSN